MSEKRPYRQQRRAERAAETRRRITEATVELHGSVGPARTTISAIAERAGVERLTVYRHFPDEDALYAACSGHWRAEHPAPDIETWAAIADPTERLGRALDDLYVYYRGGRTMLENVLRDAPGIPALARLAAGREAYMERAHAVLAGDWAATGAEQRLLGAVIAHALDFRTWASLCDHGLSDGEAARLMVDLAQANLVPRLTNSW